MEKMLLFQCETFRGREDLFLSIRNKLNSKVRKPLVLYAESGAGKTSVVARLMELLPTWYSKDSIFIVRYLGTSMLSTSIYDVLFQIAGQLSDALGSFLEPQGYRNMNALREYFPRCLRQLARSKTASGREIVILLDSLDQLSPANSAHTMNWLPIDLPSNVNIILSTLPRMYGCLTKLQARIAAPERFIEISHLPESVGLEIADAFLSSKKRRITDEQMDIIRSQLHSQPTPLLIKILLDQVICF